MAALPRSAPVATSAFGSGTYAFPRPQRAAIVVLDRDTHVRGAIAGALGGWRVHEADSLASAAQLIDELRPRVVVCSIAFDPLELACFARWMRATFARSIALVLITVRGDTSQAIRAVQLGARACVELPLDPAHVRAVVTKHGAA